MLKKILLPLLVPLALILLVVVVLGGGENCFGGEGDGGELSDSGREDIPGDIADIYHAMAQRWNLDVAFLASIGAQESDHGRNAAAEQVNSAGCQGLMQLGTGGRCGDYWGRNKCDGNDDGRARITDPWDNICAAAKGLRGEKQAPPTGGSSAAYRRAACNYYGACGDGVAAYADQVMARAESYGFQGGQGTDTTRFASNVGAGSASCALAAGDGSGNLRIDPGANAPGLPLSADMQTYAQAMADLLPRPLILTSGSRPGSISASGNVSDHSTGNGADFGSARNGFPATGGGYGDTIAAAAFIVAGETPQRAARLARRGGVNTINRGGLRIQILWKTYVGGNHFSHPHVGLRRIGAGVSPGGPLLSPP